ncbi:hypothetical protein BU14_0333s0016 [Porphyra umbilicalis]|uniref:Uncharacterized protein n=1 Tax=Porphyra umbilicalis TaxID=2786 RepID=A0A1X6NYF0_PORUM|nr:hypothetical protein BU14_0333s0016 [Porphyra umbilicalis]|eukprot:OSX73628.1 hypothetical protein BU14_0333s0016 [Porphyra umbilicalis]
MASTIIQPMQKAAPRYTKRHLAPHNGPPPLATARTLLMYSVCHSPQGTPTAPFQRPLLRAWAAPTPAQGRNRPAETARSTASGPDAPHSPRGSWSPQQTPTKTSPGRPRRMAGASRGRPGGTGPWPPPAPRGRRCWQPRRAIPAARLGRERGSGGRGRGWTPQARRPPLGPPPRRAGSRRR